MSKAWSIWWHPCRTARELVELEERLAASDEALSEKDGALAALRSEMEEERRLAAADHARLEADFEAQGRRLADLERESAEWENIRREMLRVNEQLDLLADMKKEYERKIERLRLRLRDASPKDVGDDDMELIDMQEEAPPTPYKPRKSPSPEKPDDTQWLRSLPDDL